MNKIKGRRRLKNIKKYGVKSAFLSPSESRQMQKEDQRIFEKRKRKEMSLSPTL